MEEFKGTKGKWQIGIALEGETANIIVKTSGQLLTVENKKGNAVAIIGRIGEEEQESNAKVIAVAPEMLEILVKSLSEFEQCQDALFELMEHQDGWESNLYRVSEKIEKIKELIERATN